MNTGRLYRLYYFYNRNNMTMIPSNLKFIFIPQKFSQNK